MSKFVHMSRMICACLCVCARMFVHTCDLLVHAFTLERIRVCMCGVMCVHSQHEPFCCNWSTIVQVDVAVDELIFSRLRGCTSVEAASSEEQPVIKDLPGKGYTVGTGMLIAFDHEKGCWSLPPSQECMVRWLWLAPEDRSSSWLS